MGFENKDGEREKVLDKRVAQCAMGIPRNPKEINSKVRNGNNCSREILSETSE